MTKPERQKFWMVWSPQGRAPTVKHCSRERAEREADRLAQGNPGLEFFVLKAVGGVTAKAPQVSKIKMLPADYDEVPF